MSEQTDDLQQRVTNLERQLGEALSIAQELARQNAIITAGVLALMQSHPNKDRLRSAWDDLVSELWANQIQIFAGQGVDPKSDDLLAFQKKLEASMR